MNIEGPGDPGTVWLSVPSARVLQPLSGGAAKGEAAAGLPQAAFSTLPLGAHSGA